MRRCSNGLAFVLLSEALIPAISLGRRSLQVAARASGSSVAIFLLRRF
jgi:hypothetical protein